MSNEQLTPLVTIELTPEEIALIHESGSFQVNHHYMIHKLSDNIFELNYDGSYEEYYPTIEDLCDRQNAYKHRYFIGKDLKPVECDSVQELKAYNEPAWLAIPELGMLLNLYLGSAYD